MHTSLHDDVLAAITRYKVQGFNKPTILIIDEDTYTSMLKTAHTDGVLEYIPAYRKQNTVEGTTYMGLLVAVLFDYHVHTVKVM